MFDSLTDKFSSALRNLSGRGKISESNVREAMEQVRTALLEADVHHEVARKFCDDVTKKAVGTKVLESLHPGQQMIQIVHDELAALIGPVDTHLMVVQPAPTIVMMCGLQGSGKTTTCGKLAAYLKKKGRSVMLAAADLQRPAAVEQLHTLAKQVESEIVGTGRVLFHGEPEKCAEYGRAVGVAVTVCRNALREAQKSGVDVLILDTAGRLHVNDELMDELQNVNRALSPHQIYLVIDAMTGQDAVNSAKAFNERLELDGVILSKTDSDTRGGAALTVKAVTGKPIKFVGTGEKIDALEEFHPQRMAGRILGMGDVLSLVEKAQEHVDEQEAARLQEKMAKGKMSMDDFLGQLKSIRKMGSMKSLMGMLPGIGSQMKNMEMDDSELDKTEAMIHSMTRAERGDVDLLSPQRRRRVANGSGTGIDDVNQLVKGFGMIQNVTKQMAGMSGLQRLRALTSLGKTDLAAMGTQGGPRFTGKPQAKSISKSRLRKQKKKKSR